MNISHSLFFIFLGLFSTHAQQPNILFIMADDHAAHAIGAYGGRLASLNPSPHLDKLAEEGVLMHNAFCTNSICTPSRATLITGQYSHVNGVTTLRGEIESERQHLARLMKDAGYQTAMIGKWHLKAEPAAFDYYAVLPGQGSYFNPILRVSTEKASWPENTKRFAGYDCKHVSDVVTQISLDWLKNRKQDQPFFLMHHFKAPHDNFENAERYDFLYENTDIPEPISLWHQPGFGSSTTRQGAGSGTSVSSRNDRRNMGHHMFVDQNMREPEYTRTAYQRYLKKYLRTVKGIDDNLGLLFDYLKENDLWDNTIIVYTSDQGFMLGEHDLIDKRWMYEESLRQPFIVRYPRWFKAGSSSSAIVNNVDYAPTLLDMAGISPPDYMQGRSFLPILKGEEVQGWKTASYYRYWMHLAHHDNPAHYGIRTEEFKLIFFYGLPLDAAGAVKKATKPSWELYDLKSDPQEMTNVYHDPDYQSIIVDLKKQLLDLKEALGDIDEKYPALMEVRKKYWDQ
ncbi:MAG: sulfatase [Bacteroidota bacterium]